MTAHPNSILLVAGFGPPSLAAIRGWSRAGCRVALVTISSNEPRFCASRHLETCYHLGRESLYTESGIQEIARIARDFQATAVAAITEHTACWIQDNAHRLPPGVTVLCTAANVLRNLDSKRRQTDTAQDIGFDVLPTSYINRDPASYQAIAAEHFPLALRPSTEAGTRPFFKVHVAAGPAELHAFMQALTEVNDEVIAQPFLNAPNLIIHGTRKQTGDVIGLRAFAVSRKFQGISLSLEPADMPEGLAEKLARFVERFEIIGSFHMDFIRDPSAAKWYFLELNCRLGGTTAKIRKLGYDEPAYFLNAFTDTSTVTPAKLANTKVVNRHALMKFVLHTLSARKTNYDYPQESVLRALAFTLYTLLFTRDDVWDWHDVRGSLALYASNVLRKLG